MLIIGQFFMCSSFICVELLSVLLRYAVNQLLFAISFEQKYTGSP